jgi:hypothetical protein
MSFYRFNILFLFLLFSCHSANKENLIEGRFPASSLKAVDCKSSMSVFADVVINKSHRIKTLSKLKEANDFNGFADVLIKSNDNANHIKGAPLGFSINRARLRGKLMVWNNNRYIPSYYQYVDEADDTFGVLDILRQYKKYTDEELTESVTDVKEWVLNYKSYNARLTAKINEGFESKMQLDVLLEHRKKMKEVLEYDDVDGSNTYELMMPWIKDGKVTYERQEISDLSNINILIKDKKDAVKHIFAKGKIDESFSQSELYDVILSQAFIRRKLTFIRDGLQEMRPSNRSDAHNKLLLEVKEALADKSLLPRSDAIKHVQWKEIKSELRSLVRTQKGKRNARARFKYKITEDVMKQMQKSSGFLTYSKFVGLSLGIGAGFSFVGSIFLPITENPYYNWFFANIQNWWNDMWLSLGLSADIESCSKEYRGWTVSEACFNAIVFKHTSSYFYRSQFDDDYKYLEDPDFLKKREEIAALLIRKRDEKGAGEFHAQNKSYINNIGYRIYIDDIMTKLIIKEYKVEGIEQKLNELFDAHFIKESDREVQRVLLEIKAMTDSKLHDALVEYLANVDKMVKQMQSQGSISNADHLNEFIQETSKL